MSDDELLLLLVALSMEGLCVELELVCSLLTYVHEGGMDVVRVLCLEGDSVFVSCVCVCVV